MEFKNLCIYPKELAEIRIQKKVLHLKTHKLQRQMHSRHPTSCTPALMPQKGLPSRCPSIHQLNELERLAAEDSRPVTEIYDELTSSAFTSLDTAAYLQSWDQAWNTMYYSRTKRYPADTWLPARRQDLGLNAEQTTTKSGAQFVMYHSPTNDKLIFATEAGVRLLAQSTCWCGNGAFKIICPRIAEYWKCSIPKRKNLAYNLIRRNLFVILNSLDPGYLSDFLNTRVQGCFFHFCQAVLRQVKRLGLRTDKEKVKMLMALVFLPVNLVPAFLQLIIDELGKTETVVRQMDDGGKTTESSSEG
ncbi:hypothetical protein T4B_14135 [Trichinella pseudospiralis]|uniref:MULE transposase domain-containing protein n=1 Tax=Trichinella pseudospiralis TaxID=6337 RepID=A0A0V1HNL3_TRIPS|nr:hypothetical protein T4B_14135 [Trichinella pseudospiralis]